MGGSVTEDEFKQQVRNLLHYMYEIYDQDGTTASVGMTGFYLAVMLVRFHPEWFEAFGAHVMAMQRPGVPVGMADEFRRGVIEYIDTEPDEPTQPPNFGLN